MNGMKKWWQSSAVWGGLASMGAAGAAIFGFHPSPADIAEAQNIASKLYAHANAIIALVGGGLAVWGRLRASKKIG